MYQKPCSNGLSFLPPPLLPLINMLVFFSYIWFWEAVLSFKIFKKVGLILDIKARFYLSPLPTRQQDQNNYSDTETRFLIYSQPLLTNCSIVLLPVFSRILLSVTSVWRWDGGSTSAINNGWCSFSKTHCVNISIPDPWGWYVLLNRFISVQLYKLSF